MIQNADSWQFSEEIPPSVLTCATLHLYILLVMAGSAHERTYAPADTEQTQEALALP